MTCQKQLLPRRRFRRRLSFSIAAVVLASATQSRAADKAWNSFFGGTFSDPTKWQGNSVPGTGDIAHFGLTTNPISQANYTVDFTTNPTNQALKIEDDLVTFALATHLYTTFLATGNEIGDVAGRSARLTITGGTFAVADTSNLSIGSVANSTGTLLISTGGLLAGNPFIQVGDAGNGTLTMQNNGDALASGVIVGNGAGTTGIVNVTGGGSSLQTDTFDIGKQGTGTLNLGAGARIDSVQTTIGNVAGSSGTANVDGAGTQWNNTGILTIGNFGNGALNLSGGAVLQSPSGLIGNNAIGQVSVDGTNSKWSDSGNLKIGIKGHGTLSITNGGRVESDNGFVGNASFASGTVSVDGTNSNWIVASTLTVDQGSSMIMDHHGAIQCARLIQNAGSFQIRNSGGLFSQFDSTLGPGNNTVASGGLFETNGLLTVGRDATTGNPGFTATMNIIDGGLVLSQGGTVGYNSTPTPGDTAVVNLSGAGSDWSLSNQTLVVGRSSKGTMIVSDGARLEGAANLTVGIDNGVGRLEFHSAVSDLVINHPILVGGFLGDGTLILDNTSLSASVLNIGAGNDSTGLVEVANNAVLNVRGAVNVGGDGSPGNVGNLRIALGGKVAFLPPSIEQLIIFPKGTLTLDGGTLEVPAPDSVVMAGGVFAFNQGTLRFTDTTTTLSHTALETFLGPTHALTTGKTLAVAGDATLSGILSLSGGSFIASTLQPLGGTFIFSSGTFELTGQNLTIGSNQLLEATLSLPAGKNLLLPGHTLTINPEGSVLLSGGTIAGGGGGGQQAHLQNNGLLSGSGTLDADLSNKVGGQVRVLSGDDLRFVPLIGNHSNDGTIRLLGGTLEFPANQTLTNNAGGLISGDGTLIARITNNGTMAFSGAARLVGKVSNNAGALIISSGGGPTTFYDDVVNNGEIRTSPGGFSVFFGSLSGSGNFTGSGRVNIEGDLAPGNSPAAVSFGGDVEFGVASKLKIEMAGQTPATQYDQLLIAGAAVLGGKLSLSRLNGFAPTPYSNFDILTAASISGQFTGIEGMDAGNGFVFASTFLPDRVRLTPALVGDLNLDGKVTIADFIDLAAHFNSAGTWKDGDLNGDFRITISDFIDLASHFNTSFSGESWPIDPAEAALLADFAAAHGASAVPEPVMMSLLVPALLLARRRRS